MKKIFVFAAAIAVSLSMSAQKQMHIWMDGSALKLSINKVDSVTFFDPNASTPDNDDIPEPDPTPDPSTANGIGVFSVADGKTVSFAPGNLQFNPVQGSHLRADGSKAKGTWRLAENQWDFFGDDNNYNKFSENYDGWIDVFCWGNSGYDNTRKDPYAMFYQPWSINWKPLSDIKKDSTLNCDTYEITGECEWEYTYWTSIHNTYGHGPSTNMQDIGLYGTSSYYDWGVYNAISNGGNQAGLWRTLTRDEWHYILESRKNAQFLRSQATVNGVYGYVLLPDNFKKPAEITWSYQTNDWSINTYTIEQWALLEAIGAIFLPAHFDLIGGIGYCGEYWSTNACGNAEAYYFSFGSNRAYMNNFNRYLRYSVRLVKDL